MVPSSDKGTPGGDEEQQSLSTEAHGGCIDSGNQQQPQASVETNKSVAADGDKRIGSETQNEAEKCVDVAVGDTKW